MNYTSADAAKEISAEYDKAIQELKTQFSAVKGKAPADFADVVTFADKILASLQTKADAGRVEMAAGIPGSGLKSAVEQLPGLVMLSMLGGGMGQGAAFGVPANPIAEGNNVAGAGQATLAAPQEQGPGDPITAAREAARKSQCLNNLRQIGLAMHNSHDMAGKFPDTAIRDASGKPLLSWRVAILPLLGENALYEQFKLDQPWDSEHNKKLIEQLPQVYACPSKFENGKTSYLLVVGPGSVFENGQGRKLADIADGTSNTILLVEADDSKAVPW